MRPSQDRKRPEYLTLNKPSLSPLQIRRRRMARHRWRQRHLRPSLQLIIRRALRWHCGRRQGRRHWRGWLGVSPRRQPPLHPRRAHNGRSRLHPLLMARPEHALPLPPQSIRREHRTSHVQTDTEHNVFHSIPSSAARALFLTGAGNRDRSRPRSSASRHRASPRDTPVSWDLGAEQEVNRRSILIGRRASRLPGVERDPTSPAFSFPAQETKCFACFGLRSLPTAAVLRK